MTDLLKITDAMAVVLEDELTFLALADLNVTKRQEALSKLLQSYRAARESAGEVEVKPLDLSNLLYHAFMSGWSSGEHTDKCVGSAWADYDPTEDAAYQRIRSALA